MRADQLLVERGIATSRSQAQRLIAAGLRWRVASGPWRTAGKNGDEIPDGVELALADAAEARYVSRGGLKLEAALREAAVPAQGRVCLDVGQSTGGFTDCLLRHGATRVVGVDVGHGQLHAALAQHPRVRAFEGLNARALTAADLDGSAPADGFGLVVGDLSFISLTLVLPALAPLLAADGDLLMLVKPQFELQPGQVGKGGIVRDVSWYAVVEARLRTACADAGLAVRQWLDSAIAGGDGNREFFIHAGRAR